MALQCACGGSAATSGQDHAANGRPATCIDNVQSWREVCRVVPAVRTGKSDVTYCPGGTRDRVVSSGLVRPLKPRVVTIVSPRFDRVVASVGLRRIRRHAADTGLSLVGGNGADRKVYV